jgi:hypothetical protein
VVTTQRTNSTNPHGYYRSAAAASQQARQAPGQPSVDLVARCSEATAGARMVAQLLKETVQNAHASPVEAAALGDTLRDLAALAQEQQVGAGVGRQREMQRRR